MRPFTSRFHLMILAAILAASACGRLHSPTEPLAPTPLAEGHWASTQMCLDITASSATIGAGCGTGSMPRPLVNAQGTFSVDGTFNESIGPPPQTPTMTPAHFTGSIDGETLTLTITTTYRTFGPYKATLGSRIGCSPGCV